LKKSDVDAFGLTSHRAVSNLTFVSEVLE